VRAFVNTLDVEDSVDSLATPADLTVWLLGSALVGPGVRANEVKYGSCSRRARSFAVS
jgi:Putative stress-induced transcription regulator